MSSASVKKIATANTNILNQLLLIQIIVNLLVLVIYIIFKRPTSIKPYIIFNIPNFLLNYNLETSGRPKYVNKNLKVSTDLNQKGLIEYYFDVIYVTLFLNIIMVVFGSNKVWYLYLIIPGYIVYTLGGYVLPFLKKDKGQVGTEPVQAENNSGLSKRQQKLQQRKEKGGQQVKYR
ncbi:unnamed protein product [Candida verbasci]|uniref:Late endosome and vacuole interface protein 10 n=1 Tax=Candida verbasci TaxID=1227364 RepID=A0A9W4TXE8_9ASCO|nr:unnamed protein product [Candida verbasci]